MIAVDIVIGTTYATTSTIPIPDEYPALESIPTTQHIQGADGVEEALVESSEAHGVRITRTAVKDNVIKLYYSEIGPLKRYAGISERP